MCAKSVSGWIVSIPLTSEEGARRRRFNDATFSKQGHVAQQPQQQQMSIEMAESGTENRHGHCHLSAFYRR